MSYALNLARPTPATRARRDDMAGVSVTEPAAVPADAGAVVSGVTAVAPQRKRFRAVICRTVTESTSIEFDADETANLNAMADKIVEMIPDGALWTRDENNSWAYVDRVEDLGPASASDPAAEQTLADGTDLETPEDEQADKACGARSKRRRQLRMSAVEVTTAVQEALSEAEAAQTSAAETVEGATELIAKLTDIKSQMEDISAEPFTDDLPDEDAAAFELVTNAIGVLTDMLATAEEAKAAHEAEGAVEGDPLV